MLTQTQKLLLFSQFLASTTEAKCPFGFGSSEEEAKPEDHALPQLDDVVVNTDNKSELRKLEEIVPPANAIPPSPPVGSNETDVTITLGPKYPSDIFKCSEEAITRTVDEFTTKEYMAVAESVNELYEDAEDKNAFAGCVVRLAGHDMMDFRYIFGTKKDGTPSKTVIDQRGGSDGCINFHDKDNKGLVECIQKAELPKAYNEHCGIVSLADFIVIAAEATMARTSNSYKIQQEDNAKEDYADGTLAKTFRDQFKFGRTTSSTCDWNTDLMPDPEQGCDDINSIFGGHMFKYEPNRSKKRLTAAIMGAHTLGRAHAENSGYEGTWSSEGSEGVFDNDYYRQMLTRGWGPDLAVNGNKDRNQWKTVDSGPAGGLMLNSDLCLAYDNNSLHQKCMAENNNNNRKCKKLQNKGTPINALHSQCCAWTHKGALFNKGVFDKKDGPADLCGKQIPARGKESKFQAVRDACCANRAADSTSSDTLSASSSGASTHPDCDSAQWPKGKAFPNVLAFAANENQWLESYAQAWKIATENGHLNLQSLVDEDDEEDEYECGKLRTRKICQTDDMCAWQRKTTPDKRGRRRMHCDLASKAPPKPPKKEKKPRKKRPQKQDKQDKMNKRQKKMKDDIKRKRNSDKP